MLLFCISGTIYCYTLKGCYLYVVLPIIYQLGAVFRFGAYTVTLYAGRFGASLIISPFTIHALFPVITLLPRAMNCLPLLVSTRLVPSLYVIFTSAICFELLPSRSLNRL